MRRVYLPVLLIVFFAQIGFAQQGKNGAEIVSVNNTVVNEYTTLTADASSGATSITVADNSLNTHNRFTSSLSQGDLLMIIQMQGASINDPADAYDSTWGAITSYNNCGLYEFVQVQGIPAGSSTTINICPLKYSYAASGKVQVVRVPRFTTMTINAGDTLTCDAWQSGGVAQGGIVVVEISGNTIINGATSATANGFRGGAIVNMNIDPDSTTIFAFKGSVSDSLGAEKGESIAGYETDYNAYGGMFGRGAPANGGGGGDVWDAAGGGGGNAGNISDWTGNGNPDISQAGYITAWNLEYNGFANSTSSGGGRGGYATAGYNLGPTGPQTYGPNNGVWSYNYYRDNVGGKGGRPLNYSTGRIFFGGGGGAGHEDNDNEAKQGGNGGGIIYLLSYGTVSGSGSVISNGQNGANDNSQSTSAPQGDGDGTGGAGAGGTIIINSVGVISSISLYANGGSGGNQFISNATEESEGAAGGGGGGYIATTNSGLTTQVNGGANGITTSISMTSFPPDGATIGGAGVDTVITNTYCGIQQLSAIAGPTMVCAGLTYNYSVTSQCSAAVFEWTLPVGWTGTSTTNSISVTTPVNASGTDTIFVANCPIDTFLLIKISPAPVAPAFPRDTFICGNLNFALSAGPEGLDYLWSNGDTSSSITITDTGTYWVQIASTCDTLPPDSITILQRSLPTVSLGKDTTICNFTNFVLTPVVKSDTTITSYLWSTGAITPALPVATAGTYWVQVTNDCGSAADTVTIGNCESGYVVPNAFTPGTGNANSLIGLLKTGNGIITLQYFRIYNRWGQLIFATNDDHAKWDGTFNGLPEPIGVYVYVVNYNDPFGVSKLLKGNITLLR